MVKRKIVWSQKANIKLFEILDFYDNRNQNTAYSKKLYFKFRKELSLLVRHPEIGRKTDDESIRGLIVDNFILFYEITSNSIIVHTVWDSRQNPDNLIIR